jgi:prepilin-type N-terminal cleavage/methylation domain-containing protein
MRMQTQLRRRTIAGSATARRGITLIEVVMALTMFAVVSTSIASMTTHVARGSRFTSIATVRAGALAAQVNRLEVLPYDTLPSRAGCASVSSGLLPRSECVTVEDVVVGRRRVTFVLTPSNTALRPDTVIFERTKPKAYHPLNLF